MVHALSASATMTSPPAEPQLPLFTDATTPFTGEITASGTQTTGFAGRIEADPADFSDPTRLAVLQTAPPMPLAMRRGRTSSGASSPAPRSSSRPRPASADRRRHQGTFSAFIGQVVGFQGQAANEATNVKDGQDIVVNALQQRFNEKSVVSIDLEMSRLLRWRTPTGRCARDDNVKDMSDSLPRM